ncbi:MAG TPA: phage portal protein [Stellaceae bacterium]|nr:phage portal protein [Stellaceae bacterium]
MTDIQPTAMPIAEGLVARAARALGYVVSGDAGGWFGPLNAPAPNAPAAVAGRQFDFPSGYNLVTRPRAYEGTSFAELRALADSYDLIRLVIESRKDQIERLSWSIRARQPGGAKSDPRIGVISALFACPDGVHPWGTWLRLVLEDLLVIDAPALYLRRSRDGKLCALEPLDGATVKRVIDDWGRTPAPPAPAYQQVLKGLPAVDYTADELWYLPRNPRVHKVYGFGPVEQVQMAVNIALRRQVWQLQYYTEGNIPEALIGVPDTWTPDQIRQFQGYWDSLHEGNTAARRHAKFVPGGVAKTFIPTREPALKDPFDEWLARIVCYAFSVSPQPFVQQLNRATAETAQNTALAEGLLPLKNWVKQLCDRVIAREFEASDLEFVWSDDAPSDPAKVASIAVDYVKAGIKSVNEVRAELGLDPMPDGVAPDVRSQERLVRFNPNHYGPGPQGGQFAPAADGSSDSANTQPHAQTAQEILFGRAPLFLDEPPVELPPPLPEYPTDPTKPPGPGFEWRGKNPTPGSREGSWYNEQTNQQLRPDLDHPAGVEPHWDYQAPDGKTYRWYPDGRFISKSQPTK